MTVRESGGTQEDKFPANELTYTHAHKPVSYLTWYLRIEGNKGSQIDDRHEPEEHAPWKNDFPHVWA